MESKDKEKHDDKSPAVTVADLEAREKKTEGQNQGNGQAVRAGAGRYWGPGRF